MTTISAPEKSTEGVCRCNANIFTVISGSFRKNLKKIVLLKDMLMKQNIYVLSPSGAIATNPQEEFIILDSDPISHPKILQDSIFAKMRQSTFLVVANFEGYLGNAAVLEMGYAIALGMPIFSVEEISDPNIAPYCQKLESLYPNFNVNELC